MKKDIISVNSSKIILSVTLKKKNKTKNNKFEFNLNIDDPKKNDIDLFLFLNFRMICEFEESILKDIECGWHIDDCHRKYELEMVSKKYKESKYYIETVRDIIFNLTGKIRYYQKSKKSRN